MGEPLIYIKLHSSEHGAVVGMCDESLIDKMLDDGKVMLDIKTYHSFYQGKLESKEAAKKMLAGIKKIYSANIVGVESVEIGLEAKLIQKEHVLKVKGVPYAHAYNVSIS